MNFSPLTGRVILWAFQDFVSYRIFCQLLAASGIICIVLSHEHYTIDILIAYFVTTHHFWVYHTMASDSRLEQKSEISQFFENSIV